MDSVHTWKMELTEFPEELDVGCEDREDTGWRHHPVGQG